MEDLVGRMRLLDLFCGAGGAAMGYHQAGFDEIVGVDIEEQLDEAAVELIHKLNRIIYIEEVGLIYRYKTGKDFDRALLSSSQNSGLSRTECNEIRRRFHLKEENPQTGDRGEPTPI